MASIWRPSRVSASNVNNGRGRGTARSTPWRGRFQRGRGGALPTQFNASSASFDRSLLEGLQSLPLETLSVPQELNENNEAAEVENVKYMGSYHWMLDATPENPSMLVPGSPPEWTDRAAPFTVAQDDGFIVVDQAGFIVPFQPLLPALIAVDEMTPDFDWPSVDIISNRNCLAKLLSWIREPQSCPPFRIDAQLAGDSTVLLNRWEARTKEQPRSWGLNFEKATTEVVKGCEGTSGYHRIVNYTLGQLNMVVRFQVDACFPSSSTVDDEVDALTERLANVRLREKTSVPLHDGRPLVIHHEGKVVPQSALIELTTFYTDSRRPFNWQRPYTQLSLTGTPNHILGLHHFGKFSKVEKRSVDEVKDLAPASSAQDFSRLESALQNIKDVVLTHGRDVRLSFVCEAGEMKVHRMSGRASCLPDSYLHRFSR
ncbi:hypothetical protein CYLTODRAFT_417105 [Cylindrobasidium torrendii FP15055 ss-10]|uniref:Geranylgeranyl pyrophosphate synthetase n=1 Tax=Cylindrobasidium torrendii FP15055 ss-10 TaxID=1314674 RepID=A0A0D7BT49_9AGAR|nr:hypothetical protein CYLTODRAFT_417105 [Cylindrobasidium torrendii FP15055 ss-10]